MKNVMFVCLLLSFIAFDLKAQPSKPEERKSGPQLTFETLTVDYGTIQKGDEPLRKFTFTNTGNAPLVITSAKGSCGCTVPTFPAEAIAPGHSSVIEVRYDTKRVGQINKTITVSSNTGEVTILKIIGEVMETGK